MKSTWNSPSVQLLYIFMCLMANKYHKPSVQSIWLSQKKFFWKLRSKLQQVLYNSHSESTGGSQQRICQARFTLPFLLLYLQELSLTHPWPLLVWFFMSAHVSYNMEKEVLQIQGIRQWDTCHCLALRKTACVILEMFLFPKWIATPILNRYLSPS